MAFGDSEFAIGGKFDNQHHDRWMGKQSMAYGDEEKSNGWLKRIGAIPVGIVCYFIIKTVISGGFQLWQARSTSASDVEQAIAGNADVAPLFNQLQQSYPQQYAQFLEEMAANARSGISSDDARRRGAQFVRSFIVSKTNAISQAPVTELRSLAQAQLELTEQLERDGLQLCANYSMVGLSPTTSLQPATSRLMANVGVATILAAHAGERNPANRSLESLSDADANAWAEAMLRSGGTERLLVASSTPNSLSPRDQCDLGKLAYRGALALPQEQSARLIGFLMRESAAMPMPQ